MPKDLSPVINQVKMY